MAAYWDTSCVLKLYCREADSGVYLQRIAQSTEPVRTSELTLSEMAIAFHQKALRGEIESGAVPLLSERLSQDVQRGRFLLLPFGEDVREEAQRIAAICYAAAPAIPLRTLDGLHLATARLSACRELVTTDSRMRSAAPLLGLRAV